MENAADALKLAAAILIFIIAIASSFSLFGTAKETADSIITMRDKQAYLEAAELDNGILYTSSTAIESGNVSGFTTDGYRVVSVDDIISTISRYDKEKYGVTVIDNTTNEVIVRFDSSTESYMSQWYSLTEETKEDVISTIKTNLSTVFYDYENIYLNLEDLYKIEGHSTISCGSPWYGDEIEIQKRIAADLAGSDYKHDGFNGIYKGKGLLSIFEAAHGEGKKIVEIVNEIDKSKYLTEDGTEDGNVTDLPVDFKLPGIEVIYIID